MSDSRDSYGFFISFSVILLLIISSCSLAGNDIKKNRFNPTSGLIDFYSNWISPVDGDRCLMHPSCSEYCRQAVEKHGLLIGWIMTCDRLQRCGRSEISLGAKTEKNGRLYSYDPVSVNDFWWHVNDDGVE